MATGATPSDQMIGHTRQNLKDEIAMYVRDLIFSGQLKPGDRIPQDQIASTLGVSKLPVRESLIALGSEGLVRNIPRQGSFVEMLEPEDIVDHYKIFGMLSGLAVEHAADRLSGPEIDELERIIEAIDGTDDPSMQSQLNWQYHEIINLAGSSLRLRSIIRSFAKSIPSRFFEQTKDWTSWGNKDHRAILNALRSRDGKAAAERMELDLARSGTFAVEALREVGFWGAPSQEGSFT